MVKHTIRQHYQDKLQIDTGDLKKTWKTMNKLMNKFKKDTKISELRTDDNETIDLSQIPNAFNLINILLNWEVRYVMISHPQPRHLRIILQTSNVQQIHYTILNKYLRQKS